MIGVVGGVGPYAGLNLVEKIFEQTVAVCDQDHVPLALLSLPGEIPDRTGFLLNEQGPNPAEAITRILFQLEGIGASVAGIACNTTHAFPILEPIISELERRRSRLRLLNMIQETVRFASEHLRPAARVGILSTYGTYKSGVYHEGFCRAGFEVVSLDESDLVELVHASIYHPKWGLKACSQPVSVEAQARLSDACRRLEAKGADAVVLGCTELPLALRQARVLGMQLIDPTLVLARALILASCPQRLKPLPPVASVTS